MFGLSTELGFTVEDMKRAQEYMKQGKTSEQLEKELIEKLKEAKEGGKTLDEEVMSFANAYGVRTLLASAMMGLNPIDTIAMTLLVGIQIGMVIEQTKPGTFRLEYMREGGNA